MLSPFFSNRVSTPFPLSRDLTSTTREKRIGEARASIENPLLALDIETLPMGQKKKTIANYIYTIQHKK
jgi:hypothetical protein